MLFRSSEDGSNHGSFNRDSYAAMLAEPRWHSRLLKAHTQRAALPEEHRSTAMELDSCNSSDALLMNFFCFPGFSSRPAVVRLVGHRSAAVPEFGVFGRVPLRDQRTDATEIDMKIGEVIVESKLTEVDFTSRPKQTLERYADFADTFEVSRLPHSADEYHGYQLIRNVLCASAYGYRFMLMCDGRRPDLIREWWTIIRAIRNPELRDRMGLVLWQELAAEAAPDLRAFLAEKYEL